jgi:hypothetical protein
MKVRSGARQSARARRRKAAKPKRRGAARRASPSTSSREEARTDSDQPARVHGGGGCRHRRTGEFALKGIRRPLAAYNVVASGISKPEQEQTGPR